MKELKKFASILAASAILLSTASCGDDNNSEPTPAPEGDANYMVCMGITANSSTSYYLLPVAGFMEGTISASGNQGLELNGYHSFQSGNDNTVFAIGGLGLTDVNVIRKGSDGKLSKSGTFTFDNALSAFEQADENNMVAIDIPKTKTEGNEFKFYNVDIKSGAITKKVTKPVTELSTLDWPLLTGMAINNGKIYITYYLSNVDVKPTVTRYIDKAYVAVYSYPDFNFITTMEDSRSPILGSWSGYNGIFKTEDGSMYTFANTSVANGFTQNSSKPACFLHIPAGTTQFDDYYFDVETAAGGLKPVHMQYVGNGKFFAQVSTVKPADMKQWNDVNLKACIIDVKAKTVTDVAGIPVHNGDGGQRMSGIVDGNYFYYPFAVDGGLYFYQIDVDKATAIKGAKVAANFVSGTFNVK